MQFSLKKKTLTVDTIQTNMNKFFFFWIKTNMTTFILKEKSKITLV
jgi:hypothetical protein